MVVGFGLSAFFSLVSRSGACGLYDTLLFGSSFGQIRQSEGLVDVTRERGRMGYDGDVDWVQAPSDVAVA